MIYNPVANFETHPLIQIKMFEYTLGSIHNRSYADILTLDP